MEWTPRASQFCRVASLTRSRSCSFPMGLIDH